MKGKILLLSATCFAQYLQAQNAKTTDSLQELTPIEVRSTRANQNQPFAITNLSKKDIDDKNSGQDIPYLLQHTPSAIATSDAGAGIGYTGLRIRGTDDTRINITLNGVPVNNPESQSTFFVNMGDMSSGINSVQIQRGVGTSTNGTGAFGATISFHNLDPKKDAHASLWSTVGSFGTRRVTLQGGTGLLNNQFAMDVRLSQINSNGFIDRGKSHLQAAQVNAVWMPTKKTQFKFLVMTGKEKTDQAWNGVPGEKYNGNDSALKAHYENNLGSLYFTTQDSVNLFTSDPRRYNYFTYHNQTDNYQQDYYQLHWQQKWHNRWSSNTTLFLTRGLGYYEEFKNDEKYSSYGMNSFVLGNDTLSRTDLVRQLWLDNYYYGALGSLFYTGSSWKLTLGAGYQKYDGLHYGKVVWADYGIPKNYEWYNNNASKKEFNVFTKAEGNLFNSLMWFADVQLRKVDYTMNGFRKTPELHHQVNYTFLNPKVGINWQVYKRDGQLGRAYASISKAAKEPNRQDFESGENSLPKPEHLTDAELGFEHIDNKWQITVNGYWMQYRNQLILTGKINDVGAYTRENVDQSFRAGIELGAAWKPNKKVDVQGNITVSKNKINHFTEYVDNYDSGGQVAQEYSNTDIALSPNLISSILANFYFIKNDQNQASFYTQFKQVGKQYLDNTQNDMKSLSAYQTIDLGLKYQFKVSKADPWLVQLTMHNALNQQYAANGYTYSYIYGNATSVNNYFFPQAGRFYSVSLKLNL